MERDQDLKRLVTRGLRRVRRVLTSRRARRLLVEVLETVEDQDDLGILMVNPGSPICGSSHRVRDRESRLLTTTGRKVFWRNMVRITAHKSPPLFTHEIKDGGMMPKK
jgi:DNA polymerase alpha-associated DNA helicase A